MPFNPTTGIYTGPSGSTNANPGDVIRSTTWDSINTDVATALTQLAAQYWMGGTNATFVGRIAVKANVNFNVGNTDTPIAIKLPIGLTRYTVVVVVISGASASLTTATCGLFSAAGGAGTPIITAATSITVSTASENTNNNSQYFPINNQNTQSYNANTLFFRVATAEGSAATATVTIMIEPLS